MTIENASEEGLPQSRPSAEPNQIPVKKPVGWTQSPGAKFIMVGFITVILLVPALLVWGIVDERSRRATSVANSISQGWGGQQTLNGPFLVLPYIVDKTVGDKVVQETRQAVFSAEKMSFDADVDVEERRKSIYSIPLFQGKFKMKGRFAAPDLKSIRAVSGRPDFANAFLVMGVSDNSGFRSDVLAKLDGGKALSFEPGLGQLRNKNRGGGIHLPLSNLVVGKAFDFEIDMVLNGSRSLTVVPAGKNTDLTVKSNWPHPGFDGRFLPLEADALGAGDRDDFVVEVDPVLAPLKQVTVLRELIPDSSEVSGEQVMPNAPRACAGSAVDIPDKLTETGLLPAHGFDYHDPFSSSCPKQRLREVAARVMVAMY